MLVGGCIDAYGIRSWPMADDEVPTLVELGLTHVDPAAFSVPAAQIGALPRTLPVWYPFSGSRSVFSQTIHSVFVFRP
jgi:hypothetical protein